MTWCRIMLEGPSRGDLIELPRVPLSGPTGHRRHDPDAVNGEMAFAYVWDGYEGNARVIGPEPDADLAEVRWDENVVSETDLLRGQIEVGGRSRFSYARARDLPEGDKVFTMRSIEKATDLIEPAQ